MTRKYPLSLLQSQILGLVSPVLGAFVTFWYVQSRGGLRPGSIARERWLPAIALTLVYHLFLMGYLADALYFQDYRGSENGIGEEGLSFEDQIANVMQLGIYLSAFATAPVAFLVGSGSIEARPDEQPGPLRGNNEPGK